MLSWSNQNIKQWEKMVVICTVVDCEIAYDIIVKYGMQQEFDVLVSWYKFKFQICKIIYY